MEAYNQMVSGFISNVQGKVICDKFVVIGKVRHSQCMNEPPLPVWIISSKEGTVTSAHCLGWKAGLSETCTHVASVSFYIETWMRINGKLACTQVKCTWLLLTYVSEVLYAVSGCVAPLPCRPRLRRLNRSYVAPTSELCRPNIVVVSPQHQSCVAQTRNFAYQVKVCKILRSIYANDRLIT